MRWSSISVDNYLNLFEDDDFYTAAANTLFYVVVCVPISLSLSLLLAIGLNQNIRGKACCAPAVPAGGHHARGGGHGVAMAVQ